MSKTKGVETLPMGAPMDEYVDRLIYQTDLFSEIGRLYVHARKAGVAGDHLLVEYWMSCADEKADLVQRISGELGAWRKANPDAEGRW